jgi:hypothetical protein
MLEAQQPDFVSLRPVPNGKKIAAIITHEILNSAQLDWSSNFSSSEASRGVSATYFVQSKFVGGRDDLEKVF